MLQKGLYGCNTYAIHMVINERKTKVTSIAINGYLTEKAKKLVDTGRFSSVSDVIITALTEFLYKNEVEQENINAIDLLLKLQNNPDCRIELENIMSTTKNNDEPVKIVQNPSPENEETNNKKVKKSTTSKNQHITLLENSTLKDGSNEQTLIIK